MLNIWQVYFDETTKASCYPEWKGYDNSGILTEFFENSVIEDLMLNSDHLDGDYFGVFSHDVKEGINFREDGLNFSPKNLERIIERHDIDVFSFQKRRRQENIVTQAERYHKGFLKIMHQVLEHCGFRLPNKLDKIVLFNYMVCRPDFWESYYYEMLKPAMSILKEIPEAYNDSGYALIGRPMTKEKEERFIKAFGKPHYPFHPFICERLASIYLQLNPQFTFKQIF